MKLTARIFVIALVSAALVWGLLQLNDNGEGLPAASLSAAPADESRRDAFQRADGPRDWNFPADFGPHPDYQTEWWYYTGNLVSESGERFGYQLTFFRRALLPTPERSPRDSAWGTEQVYMAHFALSDVEGQEHYAFERLTRGAAGLAGAQAAPFQVWLEDWAVRQTSEGIYRLTAAQAGLRLDLTLTDRKAPVFHGQQGYSQKGAEAGNASYYFSQTRLESTGVVAVNEQRFPVTGLSWMDHEFSTSALSAGQVGWDWFSIQLDDGSELMLFQIRRADGRIDPFSSGTWISPGGETQHLERQHFEIQVLDTWRSSHSDATYPAAWRLLIPDLDLNLAIEPYFVDQEMNVSYAYWEGAVRVYGTRSETSVTGRGYVEMTGYAASMEGEF